MCCTNGIPETALGFRAKPTAWRDAGNFRPRDAGGSGPKWLLCMFAARKCPDARDDVVPVQSLYSRDPMRAPPTLRWFGPLTMRDGLRTSETEHDESLLGPFQPDDGLAWHASVPPNFPDGDTDNAAQPRHDSSSRTRCLFALEPMLPSFDARWLGPEHQRPNLRCANSEGHLAYNIQDCVPILRSFVDHAEGV